MLQEYYVTVTRKLRPGLTSGEARDDVRALLVWKPVSTDAQLMELAWSVQDRFQFSWWDSLIVSAAQLAGCQYLLSEDLQDGQDLDGVKVISPFSAEIADAFPSGDFASPS